jgi:phospholipid/cholesterol/gamma-HCH transport system substrate-binding protein
VVVLVIVITGGGSTGYTVRAAFRDVDGLRQGSTVKIDGVAAGLVTSLTVTRDSTAMVTMTLDPGTGQIGQGASVQVRPTDLLGERYAQLTLGDQSKLLPSGSLIPMSRTGAPVDLDDVLNMLDADTRARVRILINEAGIALAGQGADFNTLLAEMPPNLGQAQQLLGQVAAENTSLQGLITQGNQVVTTVNAKRDDMGHAIDVADAALDTVALKQAQLGQTMVNAPGALSQLKSTLSDVGTASDAILPAAASLQQTSPQLATTLRELPSFAASAQATLQTAVQVAPQITKLGVEARSPLVSLRSTAGDLQAITHAAVPILNQEDSRGMRDLLWFIENWALGTKGRDAFGHFVGAELQIDPSIIQTVVDSFLHDGSPLAGLNRKQPAASATVRPTATPVARPATTPAPTVAAAAPAPSKPSGLAGITSGLSSLLGGTTSGATKALGGLLNGVTHAGTQSGSTPPTPSAPNSPAGNVAHLLNYLLGK